MYNIDNFLSQKLINTILLSNFNINQSRRCLRNLFESQASNKHKISQERMC